MTAKRATTVRHRVESDFDNLTLTPYQRQAGEYIRALCYQAELGGLKAMDPSKDIVDGGSPPIDISNTKAEASTKLGKLSRVLGMTGEALVKDMCFYDMPLQVAARVHANDTTKRGSDRISAQLKVHLTDAAEHFGFNRTERRHSSYFSRDGRSVMFGEGCE